jgi:hypothetical protein
MQPMYRRVIDHCMGELRDPEKLERLNRQITRMMLELEGVVPEAERPARFAEIREAIGSGVGLGEAPQ